MRVSMRRVLLIICVFMSAAPALQAADYTLLATPQSVEWGYYSSEAKPALTVHSLVYSPSAQTLLSALAFALATESGQVAAAQWRFVSDQSETLENLKKSGGIAFHLRDAAGTSFQHLGFKREAIFGLGTA